MAMVNTVKTTSPCVRVSPVRVTFGRSFAITACERLAAASCDLRVCIANDRLDMCLSNHGQARTRIMALRVWVLLRCDRGYYCVACAGTMTLRLWVLLRCTRGHLRLQKSVDDVVVSLRVSAPDLVASPGHNLAANIGVLLHKLRQ